MMFKPKTLLLSGVGLLVGYTLYKAASEPAQLPEDLDSLVAQRQLAREATERLRKYPPPGATRYGAGAPPTWLQQGRANCGCGG